jgi:hypothetical protein
MKARIAGFFASGRLSDSVAETAHPGHAHSEARDEGRARGTSGACSTRGEVVAAALLERAIELDDPATITAPSGRADAVRPLRKGDTVDEIAELIDSCDRTLARLSTGDERSEVSAAIELSETSASFNHLADFPLVGEANSSPEPHGRE